jgi:LmbE family N-acetylglucosaminyl deacetylase
MTDPGQAGVSLFVFAHQDDELCAVPIIAARRAAGRAVRVIFLTNGQFGGVATATRDEESRRALARLGVAADEIAFLGSDAGFQDGRLYRALPEAFEAFERELRAAGPIAEIFTLAYEGGHEDHDATHAIVVAAAERAGLLDRTRQIPFYRAGDWPGELFAAFAPLAENGPATVWPASAADRFRIIRQMRMYPSQWRVLAVLGPLIAASLLVKRGLFLQPVSRARLGERPTARPLLYERRRGLGFEEVGAAIRGLLER